MAKTDARTPPNAGQQTIEQLQQRYHELNRKKIQAETQRDSATTRLDELKAQAREKYGTDDVAKLQEKLAGIINENARKRAKYQEDLDKIEKGLAEVEGKFSEAASGAGDGGQPRK
ncbi:MAG: hypothetical protein ABSB42_22670 [Tepidisphaeraceae bacterium]|jgi:chromosome segregation ATPase